jgi:uncharacterized membrane protein
VGAGVTYHRIEVDNDLDFSSPVDNRKLDDTDDTWTKPAPGYALGTYYWRVWAINPVGENCSENTWKFTVTVPGKPVLVSPGNGTSTSPTPTFTWQVGARAAYHRIEVDNDPNFSPPLADNVVVLGATTNTWTKPAPGYASGTYYWRVWAINPVGENCSENTWKFTVIARAGVSISISPENQENLRGVTPTYTVTVGNTGNVMDNYTLTVNDNAVPSWGPMLDNYSLYVPPGENRTTTLRVMVSWYSPPETSDNITVKATSAENGNVWAENSCIARSQPPEATIYPIDDAHVRETTPDNNYGADYLYVGRRENGAAKSFLKFDLSPIPGGSRVENAMLYLYVPSGGITSGGENVQCRLVNNNNWYENTITWTNKPWSEGEVLDSRPVTSAGTWYSWDVTSFVASKFGGDNKVSFAMVGAGEDTPPNHYVMFLHKEYDGNDPYLLVRCRPNKDSVLVAVSPSYVSRLRGGTINYQVTVKNLGWENNTYELENRDNSGWPMSISPTSLENIPPGENMIATLTVTVPPAAAPCTQDKITVQAISVENASTRNFTSCVAQSAVVAMSIAISPPQNGALKGRTLEYTVTLFNRSTDLALRDNYTLRFTDNAGWGGNISFYPENRIENVLTGGSKSVKLRVTIPENAVPGTQDNITVTARSDADNVENSASCVAKSAVVVMSIAISPPQNGALKGRTLEYTVTLFNRSTDLALRDNYTLRFTDNAGWGGNISFYPKNRIENVLTSKDNFVTLRVTIPEDAVPGTQDNIIVTARSDADNAVESSASCVAQSGVLALMHVSITPERRDAQRGNPLSYTVTVTNVGTAMDNYTLTVWDNAMPSWGPTLDNYSLYIPPGGSRTTTLRVMVSLYSPPETSDNITVKATSAENGNLYAENSCIAYSKPPPFEENIYPIDDAYVNNSSPDSNYGGSGLLLVGVESLALKRAFLKFDLGLPRGSTIDNAWLYLKSGGGSGGGTNVQCYSVDNDDWTENTITWNNKPAIGAALDSQSGGIGLLRVTDFVRNQFENENDQIVSFCMKSSDESDQSKFARYYSKENTNPPYLIVKYREVNQHSVVVSISPNYASGIGTIPYSVTVKNVGWENSSYAVSYIRDNFGWPLALDNSLVWLSGNIRPGENRTTALRVTIPPGTAPYTRDEITIKVKCIENWDTIGSAKCDAISVPMIMSLPPEGSGYRGTPIPYAVSVTNPGTIPENFVLRVRDNAVPSWAPTLDNYSLYVPPGGSRTTTLRVTAPWNLPPGASDNMTVGVALAADNNVWVENSCMAYSLLSYQMLISPIDDSYVLEGAPDSNYGTVGELLVGWSGGIEGWPQGRARSFLRFYLAIPGGTTIDNAWLYTYTSANPSRSPNVQCRVVNDDDWNERTITWNNRPARGEVLDTNTVGSFGLYPWGVTDFVKNQFEDENDKIASFCMARTDESEKVEKWAKFYGEKNTNPPYLIVIYREVNQHSVVVTISPGERSWRDNVSYSVTVQNVGWENSSYTLEIENTLGWLLALDNYPFDNMRPGENRTTTLRVTIPKDITAYTRDEITVKATCVEDTEVIGSAICMAYAAEISRSVTVSILETDKYGRPGRSVTFTVIVTNTGNIQDTYDLIASDNSGWGPTSSPTTLTLTGGVSGTSTLTVLISDNSAETDCDNIIVKATSRADNTIWAENSCVAHTLRFSRGIVVSITPSYKESLPGDTLDFTVTVKNTGNVRDNFLLTVDDNAVPSWSPTLSTAWVWLENGASEDLVLRVTIPYGTAPCTRNNIQVTAQSKYDNTISDNDSCIAHVIRRGVSVGISPAEGNAGPGENATFTVTVTNTGGVADNYNLTVGDNSGWRLTLSGNSLLNVENGASRTVRLVVTIPENAEPYTNDNVTVTARSRTDNTVENSASCVAHCVAPPGVQVSISPENQSGLPGDTLGFTVTVTNTGNVDDTYDLTVSNDHGWELQLDAPTVAILAGESTTVTVSVTVPSDASEGDSTMITVTATSRGDPTKSDSATCTATAGKKGGLPVLPIAVGTAAIGGGLAAIAVLLKKGIIHLPSVRLRFTGLHRRSNPQSLPLYTKITERVAGGNR